MFDDISGRLIQSEEEAEIFIWKFIAENLAQTDRHIVDHSHDFDLFLPWLLEIVSNLNVPGENELLPIYEIEHVYMDAAWSMVMAGHLRPGPRAITGDIHDGYGKGFSLTRSGRQKLPSMARKRNSAVVS